MKPSADLFELIKKLTPTEKRYFVLNANLQKGKKNYLKLFWEVDKMEEYNEDVLKKQLKEKGIEFAQLHVTKNGLSKQILKSLRSFHERNSTQQKLFAMMADASLLEAKGLYEQCLKKLRAAHKLAGEYEQFRYQGDIQQRIIDISVKLGPKNLRDFVIKNYAELSEIDSRAKFISSTRRVSHLCFSIYQNRGSVPAPQLEEEIRFMEEKELASMKPHEASSFFAARNYYFAKDILKMTKGKAQLGYMKKLMDAWDNEPKLKAANPKDYKVDLTNYLNNCLSLGQIKEFESALSIFQSIKDKDFISEAESAQSYYHLSLLFCLTVGHFERAKKLIPEIKKCFKKYRTVLTPSRVIVISFNVFLVLFGSGDFNRAFDWLKRITKHKDKKIRNDIQVFTRVMELVLNFELEDYFYVENLHSTAYRDLRKRKQLGEFERVVLLHVRKLANTIDNRRRKMLWEKLLVKLLKINEKNKGKNQLGLMEVAIWCKSRAEKIPYFEAAKVM